MTYKQRLDRFLSPFTRLVAGWGVTPDMLTLFGKALTAVAPWALLTDKRFLAGFWLLLAGAFDTLDGALARNEGLGRPFGAFLDSSMDRISEAIVFAGFILFYYRLQQPGYVLLAFAACLLGQFVSYTRARAEGLGLECRVGVLTRAGRVVLLTLGIWTGYLHAALWLVAAGSAVTSLQRILLVRSRLAPKAGGVSGLKVRRRR